jgi:hypothetical protein
MDGVQNPVDVMEYHVEEAKVARGKLRTSLEESKSNINKLNRDIV